MSQIVKGGVVQLKSGGPKMTVSYVDKDEAICIFFDGNGEMDKATIPVECLRTFGGNKQKS